MIHFIHLMYGALKRLKTLIISLASEVNGWYKQTEATNKFRTMANEEKIFADGFSFKRNEKAPDFVVGRLSMKVDEAVAFIRQHEKGGWVNLNIKTARSGNHYVELDTYEPTAQSGMKPQSETVATPKQKAPQPQVADEEEEVLPF